jgi:hypothetical protein
MKDIKQRLMTIERTKVLVVLSKTIHELTIRARFYYDQPDAIGAMRELIITNEAIHRVSGHLRALIDANEILTPSRADGIAETTKLLTPVAVDRIYGFTT